MMHVLSSVPVPEGVGLQEGNSWQVTESTTAATQSLRAAHVLQQKAPVVQRVNPDKRGA